MFRGDEPRNPGKGDHVSLLHPYPLPHRAPRDRRAGLTLLALAIVTTPVAAQAQEVAKAESREVIALEVDGVTLARFAEVSGLNTAARAKWANITLKRGVTDSPGLRRWHEAGRERGSDARKSGAIIQYDTQGRAVSRWHFENAWPSKWEGPAHKAGAGEALVSLTLEVESIRRAAP